MSLPEPMPTAVDVIFENILDFLLPFFLAAAGGEAGLARATIQELAEAYNATTVTELDLVGRILGFSVVAMDNLRLSMTQGMSDTKVLRYRSNAAALSRAGEQCRKILEMVQGHRKPVPVSLSQVPAPHIPAPHIPAPHIPAPRIEPAPPAPVRTISAAHTPSSGHGTPAGGFPDDFLSGMPKNIEAMKRDARLLMAAFSKNGAPSGPAMAVVPKIPNLTALVDAAVLQGLAQSGGVRR